VVRRSFALTNYPTTHTLLAMRVSNHEVAAVQRFYPQIYLACHTRHHRRRTTAGSLTPHESSILAHLTGEPMRAASLARHLGIVPSTLSAAIKRLVALGHVTRTRDHRDGRAIALRLSSQGARAMQQSSVLETSRVAALLGRLDPPDRAVAIRGLALLATAARGLPRSRVQS
jgi:DNA-binding MarR family transcriptional regulator